MNEDDESLDIELTENMEALKRTLLTSAAYRIDSEDEIAAVLYKR